jgi:hypothetical protein
MGKRLRFRTPDGFAESNDQNLWMALGLVNANERTFPRMI